MTQEEIMRALLDGKKIRRLNNEECFLQLVNGQVIDHKGYEISLVLLRNTSYEIMPEPTYRIKTLKELVDEWGDLLEFDSSGNLYLNEELFLFSSRLHFLGKTLKAKGQFAECLITEDI